MSSNQARLDDIYLYIQLYPIVLLLHIYCYARQEYVNK